jgi:hypothetical protein
MHQASFEFEALANSKQNTAVTEPAVFSCTGTTRFTGLLSPLQSTEVNLLATFSYPGVYDINRWKLSTTLSFPQTLLDSDMSKLERSGGQFVQTPHTPQMIQII